MATGLEERPAMVVLVVERSWLGPVLESVEGSKTVGLLASGLGAEDLVEHKEAGIAGPVALGTLSEAA